MISSLLLVLTSGAAIWALFNGGVTAAILGAVGLTSFLFMEFPRLARVGRILFALCLIVPVAFWALDILRTDLLLRAMERAAFLTFFVSVLSFLQAAAASSPLVQRSGNALVNQPPGRRYTVLSYGAAVFGVLLNMGTLTLLGTMVKSGVDAARHQTEPRISDIRLKRMILAILRGFCSIPLWSPLTVTLAIIHASIPEVSWFTLLPYSVPLGLAFLTTGWLVDRFTFPRGGQNTLKKGESLLVLVPLVGIVLMIPATAWGLSQLLSLSMIASLLVALPLLSLGWVAVQNWDAQPLTAAKHRLIHDILPAMPVMRSEIAIFASSAFLGALIGPMIDTDYLGDVIQSSGLSAGWVLVLTFWLIALCSGIGINPIISVSVACEVLPRLENLAIAPITVGVLAVGAWTVVVGYSPFSAAVRIAGRIINQEAARIGFIWNGLYSILCGAILTVVLLVIA
ncbi:hypothetical protein SAMN06265173_11812 [Thalassovita litoralis]|uniref:H+/gluconate symporter n=1 Tax=Thalassovita litoralis TaxID=1010611 RepID=A0A521ENR8_9RHOB|nr:hypothetical protein [Thalassovita litoralis]SMO85544.1 hypothetical protein SAMN06265173_11812 [Thalassovita litoralis]